MNTRKPAIDGSAKPVLRPDLFPNQSESFFIVDPAHKAFMEGTAPNLPEPWRKDIGRIMHLIFVAVALVGLVVVSVSTLSNASPKIQIVLGFNAVIGFGLFMVVLQVVDMLKERSSVHHLSAFGQIVDGAVVSSRFFIDYMWLNYRFVSPESGKELTRTVQVGRGDLKPRIGPEPGATVKVLYANDKLFEVL